MQKPFRLREAQFPELTYASENHPRAKRWFIRSVEGFAGRKRYARLYGIWRQTVVPTRERLFSRMLDLVDVSVCAEGEWPPRQLPDGPLVIVANHPFGIGDGIAVLSLAESLGRPFRVMIHKGLMKISEMEPFSLPIDFDETKEAVRNNLAVRNEALRLLKEGVTIVIFPAGGVATASRGFGRAQDLPWKMFPARLVREARATVLPLHIQGQNGRLFHLVSAPMGWLEKENRFARFVGGVALTMRTSLLISEFARLSGKTIHIRAGRPLEWRELATIRDRKALTAFLHDAVFSLAAVPPSGLPQTSANGRVRAHPRSMVRPEA